MNRQQDREFMARALALAERGLFTATPNPRVGCVIARDGQMLGEGWHERAGEAHAEVRALADVRARGHKGAALPLMSPWSPAIITDARRRVRTRCLPLESHASSPPCAIPIH